MNELIEVTLRKKDWQLLRKHFSQDISYQAGGTFGDGDEFWSKKEYKQAQNILGSIEHQIGLIN